MLENFSQNKAAILSGLFCGVPFDGVAADMGRQIRTPCYAAI